MSRFFASRATNGGESDSDFSSSDEELLSSSEEELLSSNEEGSDNGSEDDQDEDSDDSFFGSDDDEESSSDDDDGPRGASYFLKKSNVKDSDDESDEDEGRKVVKSAKEKLLEDIEDGIASIANYTQTKSWTQLLSEFDDLHKVLPKAQKQNLAIPSSYIRSIADLDSAIQEQDKDSESKKKLNASTAKSFNTLKQRVKKQIREFQTKVDEYRADPEGFGTTKEQEVEPAVVETSQQQRGASSKTENTLIIFDTLRAIQESRGKKNVDKNEQIKQLEDLLKLTTIPFELIQIYLNLIPLRFDLFSSVSYMPVDQWAVVYDRISDFFKILEDNLSTYRVLETARTTDDVDVEPKPNAEGIKEILGSIPSLVERLDDELTKSLQIIDPHSTEYIERLKDESKIYSLIVRCQLYCESVIPKEHYSERAGEQLARVVLRRVEHIYYKPVGLIISTENTSWNKLVSRDSSIYPKFDTSKATDEGSFKEYANKLLDTLCSILYRQSNSVFRKKAMLCHIYYYAFNDEFYKARDMFLMSHLQSTIASSDPTLQVLFNRALVQLGLCAFRAGLITECSQLLQEIATSTRSKELLGQSGQRYQQQQQSLADRQRLLPFHMHINLELLECCFLTASLLVEVPLLAAASKSDQQKQYNAFKSFKRALENHDRQSFQGPPENTREYIMHAAKALQKGDWKKASELINSIKIWSLFNKVDELKEMLQSKLQIEAVRTYLITYKNYYEKFSIAQLATIFDLSEKQVSSVVSKMIFEKEINAALDQKTNAIIFVQGVEISKLQEMSILLADRANQLAECNERLVAGGRQNNTLSSHQNQQNNNSNSQQNNNSNNNHNIKFAPVNSAPGTISGGALNGMDRRQRNRKN